MDSSFQLSTESSVYDAFYRRARFLYDVMSRHQRVIQTDPRRAEEVHKHLLASPINASADNPLPRTEQARDENLRRIEEFCGREPTDFDDRVKIFYVALGAVTLLGQEEGLHYLDKAHAFKIINDEMTKKYYAAETQAIQNSFSPHIPECATKMDQVNAINLLSTDPMSTPERLYGIGLDGNGTLGWEVISISERRRRKTTATTFDVRVGTIDSMALDEGMLTHLIKRTAEVYLRY